MYRVNRKPKTNSNQMFSATISNVKNAFSRKPTEVSKEGSAVARPEVMTVCGERVYKAEELRDYDFAYFYGCAKSIKLIITKKEMADTDYIFAYEKKGEWVLSTTNYKQAKLFFKENWVLTHVPKFIPAIESTETIETPENIYEEAPGILYLKQNEKFKDTNGRIIDIQVRGERNEERIFFRVKDVSTGFDMPNLQKNLIDVDTNYTNSVDYKYFFIKPNSHSMVNETNDSNLTGGIESNKKSRTTKELFLTYDGLLHVLWSSRTGSAKLFRKWATTRLFAMQYGTENQKIALATELLTGPDVKSLCAVATASSNRLPAVYLFAIGCARTLLPDSADIYAPTDILYKYGRTNDIVRRAKEHAATFKAEFGETTHITLPVFSVVGEQFLTDAEAHVSLHFETAGAKITYKKYDELVVLSPNQFKTAVQIYKLAQSRWGGDSAPELLALKKEMDDEATRVKIENLKKDHDVELAQREIKFAQQEAKFAEAETKRAQMELTYAKQTIVVLENEIVYLKDINEGVKRELILQAEVNALLKCNMSHIDAK